MTLQEENEKLRELLREFCERVERGEVRSKSTYAKFRDALSQQAEPAPEQDEREAFIHRMIEERDISRTMAEHIWDSRNAQSGEYVLVPVQPTVEQEEVGCQAYMHADGNMIMHRSSMGHAYRAMIEAGARPAQTEQQPVVVPESWWQLIHDTLRNYRMGTLDDGYGGGYPLIDAMTADGQSVSGGIEECTYLADAICEALSAQEK